MLNGSAKRPVEKYKEEEQTLTDLSSARRRSLVLTSYIKRILTLHN